MRTLLVGTVSSYMHLFYFSLSFEAFTLNLRISSTFSSRCGRSQQKNGIKSREVRLFEDDNDQSNGRMDKWREEYARISRIRD